MRKSLTALGLALVFAGSANAANWGYEGEHGPANWGSLLLNVLKVRTKARLTFNQRQKRS